MLKHYHCLWMVNFLPYSWLVSILKYWYPFYWKESILTERGFLHLTTLFSFYWVEYKSQQSHGRFATWKTIQIHFLWVCLCVCVCVREKGRERERERESESEWSTTKHFKKNNFIFLLCLVEYTSSNYSKKDYCKMQHILIFSWPKNCTWISSNDWSSNAKIFFGIVR